MRAPDFWAPGRARTPLARLAGLLEPVYAYAAARRGRGATPERVGVPVVCVGNVTAGGAGKTPVTAAVARMLRERGARVHILSRGYGGRARRPVRVDPVHHDAREVGDEPLLLAGTAPVWVARDRRAGARAAVAAGAEILVMDDGFQNPALAKDTSLLVIDGGFGIGNGRLLPAGPLREPLAAALARADAVVLVGPDRADVGRLLAGGPPVLAARAEATRVPFVPGARVVAFAGIARPRKFFETVEACGGRLVERQSYADHHIYSPSALTWLRAMARRMGATLVTTEKDLMRIPPPEREGIEALGLDIVFDDPEALARLLPAPARGAA